MVPPIALCFVRIQGIDEARKMVTDLIEKLQKETGLPLPRFVLAGFSQGAMLATDVALHLPESPAALCVFSVRKGAPLRRSPLSLSDLLARQGVLLCEDIWKPLMSKRAGLKVPPCSLIPLFA